MAVYDDQKTGGSTGYIPDDDELRRATGIGKDTERSMEDQAQAGAAEDRAKSILNQERAAAGGQSGGSKEKSIPRTKLNDHEDSASADGGFGFHQEKESFGRRAKNFFKGKRKKQAAVASGITALLLGGSFGVLGLFSSGPLEFVHIAQLLDQFHFSHQEDASDGRFGKMIRFMTNGKDVGETRITWLESKYKNKIISKMESKGLKPTFSDKTKFFTGFDIDLTSEDSPFKGMTAAEAYQELKSKGLNVKPTRVADGHLTVSAKSLTTRGELKALVKFMGDSKISSILRFRTLARYSLVDFHPLHILDRKANQKFSDLYDKWKTNREKALKGDTQGADIDTSDAKSKTTDENGNTHTQDLNGTKGIPSQGKIAKTLTSVKSSKGFKAGGGVAGGLAAAAGIVCALRTINDNLGVIRYAQVVEPLMRMGMDTITVGNEIMSGQDVDPQELSFLAKSFASYDKNGNVTSTWDQAQSIRAEEGESLTGPDMSQSIKDILSGKTPAWLAWTEKPPVSALCSTVGTVAATGVSVVLGVVSGEVISSAIGFAASAIAGPVVINYISNLVAGNAVNVLATGAEWGNDINYGAALGANAAAQGVGGVALTAQQVSVLNTQSNTESQQDFQSKSLAYRLFNPSDYRSFTSKLIDSQAGGSPMQNVASIFGKFTTMGASLLKTPLTVFSSTTHADSSYSYGFPEIGFSQEDLDNPLVENPYSNAEYVAKNILDKNDKASQDYIKKAAECFNVTITKTDGLWDVVPGASSSPSVYDVYSTAGPDHYDKTGCQDTNDPNWLRIRFFVLDTSTMEGYACYEGDTQSCENDGFTSVADAQTTLDDTTSSNTIQPTSGWSVTKFIADIIKPDKVVGLVSQPTIGLPAWSQGL